MFGTDAAFNPDLLSGRLEEILPTIQQVIVPKITAVGLLGARLLVDHVYCNHRYYPVLGVRNLIRRIRMFFSLPDPDPLVRGRDPDPSRFFYICWAD
jgi:hypothetical protein